MVAKKKDQVLTGHQQRWVLHYTNADPETNTYLNATMSAKASGYKGGYQAWANAGYTNYHNTKVMLEVNKSMALSVDVTAITVDKVLIDLETTRRLAIQAKQYGVARQCSRDMGQFLKMFVDRIEQVGASIEEVDTSEVAQLLSDVLGKLNDDSINRILEGPSGTVTREGGVIPAKRSKAKN